MKFDERIVQFPHTKKLILVDGDTGEEIAGELPRYVKIVNHEGQIYEEGIPLTAENLNKGNWRDDKTVSFKILSENEGLPDAENDSVQIVMNGNGELWVIPPVGVKESFRVDSSEARVNLDDIFQENGGEGKQPAYDNALLTNEKTIVGAINELKNGKLEKPNIADGFVIRAQYINIVTE